MSFRGNLEGYNTCNTEDCRVLDVIYTKVSNNNVPDSINSYKINKILEAFNNFEHVLMKFEWENENILGDIKRYIMGCSINSSRVKEVEERMREWALFFPGKGIEQTFIDDIITRYRKDFIVEYSNKAKKQVRLSIYQEYLLLIKNLSTTIQEEQIEICERFKEKDSKLFELFYDYMVNVDKENIYHIGAISIDQRYIEKLMDEEFLLKTIRELIKKYIEQYNYDNYILDLKKIYSVQNEINTWIDINKLTNFMSNEKLKILRNLLLIDEIDEEYNHIIKLNELGISILTNQFMKSWESDKYFCQFDNEVLIPFDSNPLILCKYIFDRNYALKKRDFLIIFERKSEEIY